MTKIIFVRDMCGYISEKNIFHNRLSLLPNRMSQHHPNQAHVNAWGKEHARLCWCYCDTSCVQIGCARAHYTTTAVNTSFAGILDACRVPDYK